jgi:pyrroline-5-carboxylate reductase
MIGVIGCGNMASAIVKGIHHRFPQEQFITYTPSFTRAEILSQAVGGRAVRELKELSDCPVIIIACKPQQFNELASSLKESFELKNIYFISVMAALSVDKIKTSLNAEMVTRVMPNTPALYGEGVSLMLHSSNVTPEWREKVFSYFSACSKVHLLQDETLFDQATTVTGSGPAYVFYFAQTLADQLSQWGIDSQEAREMVAQLFKGSALLMEQNSQRPISEIISEVTSKGGVTIEAIKVYKEEKLDEISQKALKSAFKRSIELKKEL